MSKDESESEYDHVPPTAVERRRLVVQRLRWGHPASWAFQHPATRADVEQWAASHGLALVGKDDEGCDIEELRACLADAAEERANLLRAKADRDALMRVAKVLKAHMERRVEQHTAALALAALPEHIRREL